MWLAEQTIKFHKTNLYRKLGAKSIDHAIAIAYQRGILHLEGDTRPPLDVTINGVRYIREPPAQHEPTEPER